MRDANQLRLLYHRNPPPPGTSCRIPGSGLGICTFYREMIGRSGATSWVVIDPACKQYHAFRPEQIKLMRSRQGGNK